MSTGKRKEREVTRPESIFGKSNPNYIWSGHGEEFLEERVTTASYLEVPANSVYVTTAIAGVENSTGFGIHMEVLRMLQRGELQANYEELLDKLELLNVCENNINVIHVHRQNSPSPERRSFSDGRFNPWYAVVGGGDLADIDLKKNGMKALTSLGYPPLEITYSGVIDVSSLARSNEDYVIGLPKSYRNISGGIDCHLINNSGVNLTTFKVDLDHNPIHDAFWVIGNVYKHSIFPTIETISRIKEIAVKETNKIDFEGNAFEREQRLLYEFFWELRKFKNRIKYSEILKRFPGNHFNYICRSPSKSNNSVQDKVFSLLRRTYSDRHGPLDQTFKRKKKIDQSKIKIYQEKFEHFDPTLFDKSSGGRRYKKSRKPRKTRKHRRTRKHR
jgi:hypothetical protein